jgi:ribosomal protein S18 acetylase RimI-like enzyme
MIRPARMNDTEALHRHCYPESGLDLVRDYLAWTLHQSQKGWIVRLVAEVDGQAVGNVQLTIWGEIGEIGSLVVSAAFRRRGLARQLLAGVIEEAKQRKLTALEIDVSKDHPAILDFYQRLGFRRTPETGKGLSHPASPEPVVRLRMLL